MERLIGPAARLDLERWGKLYQSPGGSTMRPSVVELKQWITSRHRFLEGEIARLKKAGRR